MSSPVFQPPTPVTQASEPTAPIPPMALRLPAGVYAVHLAAGASEARFADLPITLQGVAGRAAAVDARLEALAPEMAAQLSPAGIAFTLALGDPTRAAPRAATNGLRLTLATGQLVLPTYGASFAERLTLYRGLGCRTEGSALTCRAFVPLPGSNDAASGRLTADLDEETLLQRLQPKIEPLPAEEIPEGKPAPADKSETGRGADAAGADAANTAARGAPPTPAGETAADWLAADLKSRQPAVYVLAASSSGDQGDFAATPFTSSSDYQLSLAVGAMQTSYAVPLPPTAGGLAPDVTLRYDSGSVDGMTLNKNNQPGWAGIGWNYEPGSITRRLKTCGLTQAPGDLCLTGDNYTISLNGIAAPLVKDASGLYHPQNDPLWKVQKLTNAAAGHPDTHKEYWLVTTPDGTKYRFGGEFDPDKTTNNDQNSAFFTPIYDQTCSSVSAYWVCDKAWKWNLDRIEDPNGNVVAFYYNQEINYYNARNGLFRKPYVPRATWRASNMAAARARPPCRPRRCSTPPNAARARAPGRPTIPTRRAI